MKDLHFPQFKAEEVLAGFEANEFMAVAELVDHPGWIAVEKFLNALMEPVHDAVYANTDPKLQLLLHHGLGMIYVTGNLEEFVSSAQAKGALLLQEKKTPSPSEEQPDENAV